LDNLVDPHNLGAIVRTALCAGLFAVIIPKDRSVPPTPAVSKASAGALEHVCLVSVTNLADTAQKLKQRGVWVVGLDGQARQSVFDADFKGPLALVVGSEEKGIRPRVKKQCDYLVSIPQFGRISSLNASVAAGVVIYEALRQRRADE
jgi:23S rRNA (guanosine2251-2'-O)-methyltransferase